MEKLHTCPVRIKCISWETHTYMLETLSVVEVGILEHEDETTKGTSLLINMA